MGTNDGEPESDIDLAKSRRKSIYEVAEEHAMIGNYAPVSIPDPSGSQMKESECFSFDFCPVYKPSWKEGSKSHAFNEQRKRNRLVKKSRKHFL
jgi:hypothetical protein